MEGEGGREKTDGATLVAAALKKQGMEWVFGIVGRRILPLALALQQAGIRYVGMRNEQAVSWVPVVGGSISRAIGYCKHN